VTPAALVITADDKSRPYGGANPQLSVSYAGFVNGEDTNVLGGILVLTTTADSSSPVGTYPISASGLTSGHYAISFVDGILTVTAATRPVLTILEVNAKGVVFLEITSDPGLRLRVQRSTNLKTWVDVTTEDNPTGTIDVSDEAASGQPHLFYRTAPP